MGIIARALDSVIAAISPREGLRRARARAMTDAVRALSPLTSGTGYSHYGASYARKSLQAWGARSGSADDDIVSNLITLRARSRDLYMGAPLATGALKTIRTNVVGSGLSLSPQPDAKALGISQEDAQSWAEHTTREWSLWADTVDCDAERKATFYQLQALALLSAAMSGDVFAFLPIIPRAGSVYDLRVGFIEADRVADPPVIPADENCHGGVVVDSVGGEKAIYVWRYNLGSLFRPLNAQINLPKRVPVFGARTGRRNILHIICDVERPGQRRGVPLLAPVIEQLKQLSRYSDAELMAAVVAGMFTVFVKSNTPAAPLASGFGMPLPQDAADPQAYELGNGSVVSLDSGEEIQTASPGRPNGAYSAFVEAICQEIGAALEIPYELLVKHFTSSYSASRAALLEAWKMFRMRRDWMVCSFCQPVYEEWPAEAVLKGRIDAPGFFDDPATRAAWSAAQWNGDAPGQLDPQKEINAAIQRVSLGVSTREREAQELTGMRFADVVSELALEKRALDTAGLSTSSDPAASVAAEEE